MAPDEQAAITFFPIGRVENAIDELLSPAEIKAVPSRLVIDPAYAPGLQGLVPGQRLMVVFHFHRLGDYDLLQHPRGDASRERRGVFSLHSPRRPNAIGVTIVDLVAIEGNVLHVAGLDAVNGTPILDLKGMENG